MQSRTQIVTYQQIATGLRQMGLRACDPVMVHSSLRSFGSVEGGAGTVIRALQDVVTDRGTLLLPSFNHFAPFVGNGERVYDPAHTKTSNGAIPETFRQIPGVLRSLNPSHPYAGWGSDARRYLERHHLTLSFGPESPLGLLAKEGGKCLFLGTTHHTNTFKHVVEMSLGAPCLGRRTQEFPVRLPDGRTVPLRTWSWRERSCAITDSGELVEREMRRLGLQREGLIGDSRVTLFQLSDCYEVISQMLADGHEEHLPCSQCPVRPIRGPFSVESDWDDSEGRLDLDSPSARLGAMVYEAC
jgi:aminoglycoside 3-N-acetyltransferase